MGRRFATLDVFTGSRFSGNPLAVVLDAEGLDTARMQSIAREFNLSETVFVFAAKNPAHRAALRIFTPAAELPFAGHPTVGTAVLLACLERREKKDASPELILEETIGPVRCRVRGIGDDAGRAEFDVPRLPVKEADAADSAAMMTALGLAPADYGCDALRAERWSAGNPFTFVPVRSLDAMNRCRVDLARFDDVFRSGGKAAAFVFCREATDTRNDFHARMFAPSMGMMEDPATGSAVAAFAGYLAVHGGYRDGERLVRIEQGVEMGRPSLMELTVSIQSSQLVSAAIGGEAVLVSEGALKV